MEWDDQIMDEALRHQAAAETHYPQATQVWQAIQRRRQPRKIKWYASAAAIMVAIALYLIPSSKHDTPAQQELKAELEATAGELSIIDKQIKVFGNDDQLLRARSRIQNHRTAVLKALREIN